METLRLYVPAMTCRHCVRTVTARLQDVAGVKTIEANADTATVVLAGTMIVGDVLLALDDSGYPASLVP